MFRNEYMREYMKKRAKQKRKEFIDKLGGQCINCGSTDGLEFDHIDPSTKVKTIGQMWSYSKEKIKQELNKCQLLCKDCHIDKSLKDAGLQRTKHGTTTMYVHHKCRCDVCRAGNAARSKKYKQKKKLN